MKYADTIRGVSGIREQIRILSQIWINVDYAREVNIPTQVKDLCVYAFVNKMPEGLETRVLREAYRRLEMGELSGDFSPFSRKPEPEPCRHPRCHNVEWHHPGVGTGFSVECQPFTIGPTECECRVPARYGTRAEPTCAACGGTGYKRR
jgi:hypothetical protein